MKSIKCFEYKNMRTFELFLTKRKRWFKDITGFSLAKKEHYQGNILKEYFIHFKNGEKETFKVVYFKGFNEYMGSQWGHMGSKLLSWFEESDIKWWKTNDGYGGKDYYLLSSFNF